MKIVYVMDRGRMNSIGLDGEENILRDQAELLTQEQVNELLEDHPDRKVMSEDDWYQVADYGHEPRSAMRDELERSIESSGDDVDDFSDDINAALDSMIWDYERQGND